MRDFTTSTHRAPREWEPGEDGRGTRTLAHAQAHRRRGAGGRAQRRQEHAALGHLGGAAQDRRLPLHHLGAEPRRGRDCRITGPSWWPISPGSSRAPTRARAWDSSSCAMWSGPGCWPSWSRSTAPDPQQVYDRLREEIRAYSEALFEKPHVVLLSKRDLLPADAPLPELRGSRRDGAARRFLDLGPGWRISRSIYGRLCRREGRRAPAESAECLGTGRAGWRTNGRRSGAGGLRRPRVHARDRRGPDRPPCSPTATPRSAPSRRRSRFYAPCPGSPVPRLRQSQKRLSRPVSERSRRLTRWGQRASCRIDPAFPEALKEIPDPPTLLFALGELALLERPGCRHRRQSRPLAPTVRRCAGRW